MPTLSIELPARSTVRPGTIVRSTDSPNGFFIIRSGQSSCAPLGGVEAGVGRLGRLRPRPRARSGRVAVSVRHASRRQRAQDRCQHAHSPCRSASRTIESGTPNPVPLPDPVAAAKMVVTTRPRAVHHRAAGVARPHQPAQRRDPARDRPAAVGVLADHRSGSGPAARAARRRGRSPGSRARRRTCPAARPRPAGARPRPGLPSARRMARSFFGSNQIASASWRGPLPCTCTVVSSWPATTWALVTTIPFPATQPEPCTPSPQAVPSTFTTLRTRGAHLGIARDRRVGRPHARIGTVDPRERVEARERLEQRARRRQHAVQLLEDRRALDRLAQLAGARRLQRHGARDPREAQAQAAHEHRARRSRRAPRAGRRGGGAGGSRAPPARTPAGLRAAARPRARTGARRATANPPRAAAGRAASPPAHRPRSPPARARRRSVPAGSPKRP